MQNRKTLSLRRLAGSLMLATSMLAVSASAHEQVKNELFNPGASHAAGIGNATAGSPPPLYEGLGDLSMELTTKSAVAQAYFDQGLRLAWAFNHAEARRSFHEAQRLDPECAMCFWGEAFVLGPNINDAMRDEAAAPARNAIDRALALRAGVTLARAFRKRRISGRHLWKGTDERASSSFAAGQISTFRVTAARS